MNECQSHFQTQKYEIIIHYYLANLSLGTKHSTAYEEILTVPVTFLCIICLYSFHNFLLKNFSHITKK